ncbi:MAG: glycosyltransferase [Nitrospiraceae bacterium]|jgi:predicted glycosyltransferase|nr:glycosyltransferase [Nitrospiraceae bacterium]
MRILFSASNGLGLGHLNRLLSLALAIRNAEPGHEILFLTNSEAGPFPEEFPFFTIRIPGKSRAKKSGLTLKSYIQTVRPLFWQAVASFDPHVLVVDTFPEGPEGELRAILEWPIKKIFIFREIDPDRWPEDQYSSLLSPFHKILVPHAPGEVPLPSFFETDPRVHFIGPVTAPVPVHSREEARSLLGIDEDPTFLVTLGGGGDPDSVFLSEKVASFLKKREISFRIATGPLARVPANQDFPREKLLSVWPLKPWLGAFDGVISSGGYNTFHEVIEAGIPALFIPFQRALDPQKNRILRAVSNGLAFSAKSSAPHLVMEALSHFLENRSALFQTLNRTPKRVMNGASSGAAIILDHPLNAPKGI